MMDIDYSQDEVDAMLHASDIKRMAETRKWDIRFMKLARHISTWSKDPSTKVGAVTTAGRRVLGLGYNGFPAGCNDSSLLYKNRSIKYPRVVHAEMNAILQTNSLLAQGNEITLFATLFSCADCAGPIINFGVRRVVFPEPNDEERERWGDSQKVAMELYLEAGLHVDFLN